MSDARTQAALLLALGAMAVRLGVSEVGLSYIRPFMQPVLVLAGALVLVLGGLQLWRAVRRAPGAGGAHAGHDHAGHDHGGHDHADEEQPDHHAHGMGAAWLLIAPVVALLLVAPQPLGSFAADQQGPAPLRDDGVELGPLPEPRDGAVPLDLGEYTARALYDPDASLADERVRLTGFVVPDDTSEGDYRLTRFRVTCCAADATAIGVRVIGDAPRPEDQWVTVEGTWEPLEDHTLGEPTQELPVLRVDEAVEVDQPVPPYEY